MLDVERMDVTNDRYNKQTFSFIINMVISRAYRERACNSFNGEIIVLLFLVPLNLSIG